MSYQDILIYCADSALLDAEIGAFDPDGDNHDFYSIPTTPRKESGAAFVALVRADAAQQSVISGVTNLTAIGSDAGGTEYNFEPGGEALYDAVYSQATIQVDDGQGGTVPYTPPAKIGVFF